MKNAPWNPVRVIKTNHAFSCAGKECGHGPWLLVASPGSKKRGDVQKLCRAVGIDRVFVIDCVSSNPQVHAIQSMIKQIPISPVGILALGGGSSIDTAKAIAFGLTAGLDAFCGGPLIVEPNIPIIAIPTTAGTGSEVTPFATLWLESKKISICHPGLYPKVAILDPALTQSLPTDTTRATALDALTQCLESLWSKNSEPQTETLAIKGIQLILKYLPVVIVEGGNLDGRSQLQEAALLSGLAISQTRTSLCHSISYPLTGHLGVPHGIACSFTTPAVWHLNRLKNPKRFDALANQIAGSTAAQFEEHLMAFFKLVGANEATRTLIPSQNTLNQYRTEMFTPGRSDNCQWKVTEADLQEILDLSWKRLAV